ncbi:MAG: TDT family transporter [Clostridium sp.]|uniref:TDT family transporter n=1 Tax=Clostridium sp. TaxID=1506 RepID=UPI003EE59049
MRSLFRRLENYPIAMCGASLAFITLSKSFEVFGFGFVEPIAITFAIIGLYFMVLKVIFYPRRIIEELKNPILGSFYPTFNMALFLVAGYIVQYDKLMGRILWLVGVLLHIVFFLVFFGFRARKFKIEDMVPSWFFVLVGMVVGTVSGSMMGFSYISKGLFIVGLVLYIVVWPIMLYRLFKKKKIMDAAMPSVGVLATPASLCIVGYFALTNTPNIILLAILFVTSIFNLIYVYFKIPNALKNGFAPIQAGFTFPLAISVLAILKIATYFDFLGYTDVALVFRGFGVFELVIATVIMVYVIINFIISLIKAIIYSFSRKIKVEIED